MSRLLGRRRGPVAIAAAAAVVAVAVAIAVAALVAALAIALATPAAAATPPPSPTLTLNAQPRELPFGHSTVVSGTLTAAGATPGTPLGTTPPGTAIAGQSLELQASRYPFAGYRDVGHATTASDGSFAFPAVRPDRNTRFKVVDLGMPDVVSAPLAVLVDAPAIQHIYRQRDGQAMVTVLSYHGRDLRWGGRPVYWFAAPFGSRAFTLMTVTRTRDVRPGVTYMTATFFAPAKHFVYRVCFDPPLERAFGPPHPSCPTTSFVLPRHSAKGR